MTVRSLVAALIVSGSLGDLGGGLARAQEGAGAPAPAPAPAPEPTLPDRRPVEAKAACASGRVETGIEILGRLYAETNELMYVFNQGRCYQQNGLTDPAIQRFREFLRSARSLPEPEQPADAIRAAEGHLETLEADRDRAAAAPVLAPSLPSLPPAGGEAPIGLTAAPTETPAGADHRRLYRVGTIACGVLAAAGIGAGIVFGLEARRQERAIEREAASGGIDGQVLMSRVRAGNRDQTLQWVGYAVGTASLAAGAVLLYLDLGRSRTRAQRSFQHFVVVPTLGSDRAGVTVRQSF
jgi:hypothetical protein